MILGDVFHLLSLFFLRIGKSRESPAAFCQLASMIRLLKHMNESAVYTEQDLVPYADRLAELREIIENDSSSRGREEGPSARENALTMLLMKKFQVCDKLLHKLRAALERVSPELADLHARLIHLRRYLASVASRPHPHTHDISHALRELREIEEGRLSDGRFLAASVRAAKADKAAARAKQLRETKEAKRKARQDKKREAGDIAGAEENESDSSDDDEEEADDDEVASDDDDEQALMDEPGAVPEEGQELIAGLLETNFEICQDIQARESEHEVASGPLEPIYHRLCELRSQLERLALTHRWTLRETDLYNYMMVLSDIDSMRKDGGKFRDSEGNVPKNQLVSASAPSHAQQLLKNASQILLYLLRRCYGLVYRLMASSDPISEELIPYANVSGAPPPARIDVCAECPFAFSHRNCRRSSAAWSKCASSVGRTAHATCTPTSSPSASSTTCAHPRAYSLATTARSPKGRPS